MLAQSKSVNLQSFVSYGLLLYHGTPDMHITNLHPACRITRHNTRVIQSRYCGARRKYCLY